MPQAEVTFHARAQDNLHQLLRSPAGRRIEGEGPYASRSFAPYSCRPPNACDKNSLTPARPVRLSHTGPSSRLTSIVKSRNGQHLRSNEIHSATCASAIRQV